jgi:hypothetical protein
MAETQSDVDSAIAIIYDEFTVEMERLHYRIMTAVDGAMAAYLNEVDHHFKPAGERVQKRSDAILEQLHAPLPPAPKTRFRDVLKDMFRPVPK